MGKQKTIGSFFLVCICCYLIAMASTFTDSFYLFIRSVCTLSVSVWCYRGQKVGSLGDPDTTGCNYVVLGGYPLILQEQYMLLTCVHWTETTHGCEAMYPCLVSEFRELQFGLSPTPGDISYLYLRMSVFTSKLWLLFTYWLRDFIMSFVE